MECRFNKKYAFSLAEAMVMLVIIAIVMAMAAPLIAHKANADAKRLIFLGTGSNIATAMGNNQNFGIGIKNPDAKLTVNAVGDDKNLVAKFISNFVISKSGLTDPQKATRAKNVIFQVTPKTDAYTTAHGNPDGFQVFADGTTNVACTPDYDNIQFIYQRNSGNKNNFNDYDLSNPDIDDTYGKTYLCTPNDYTTSEGNKNSSYKGITYIPKQNGYLISSRALTVARATKYTNDSVISTLSGISVGTGRWIGYNPATITAITSIKQDANKTIIEYDNIGYKFIYNGYVIVPVGKGNAGCFYYPMSKKEDGKCYYEDRMGIFAFVPCV